MESAMVYDLFQLQFAKVVKAEPDQAAGSKQDELFSNISGPKPGSSAACRKGQNAAFLLTQGCPKGQY